MKPRHLLRGLPWLLAFCLAASAAIRAGGGVGAALARAPDAATSQAPLQCPDPPIAVVEALKTRENRVQAEEAALRDRMAALDLSEQAARTRLAELTEAEDRLRATITVADGAAERDVAQLVAVYEAMKPADAARLFSAMTPDFAAGFIGRMRPETAAQVMSGMKPDLAFQITAEIAGRNARAPQE